MRKPGADQPKKAGNKMAAFINNVYHRYFFLLFMKNSEPNEKTRINSCRNLIVIQ